MDNRKRGYIVAFVLFIIAVFLMFFINGRETKTSSRKETEAVSALRCTANGLEGAFFASSTANMIKNEIKTIFRDGKMDKIFYAYSGVYRSHELAAGDDLHARYNIYMGRNNLTPESLSPIFSLDGNKLNVSLYVDDYEKINPITAVFFFVDSDKIGEFQNYTIEEMKSFYEQKDFICEIVE